jgi:hypothetical protein
MLPSSQSWSKTRTIGTPQSEAFVPTGTAWIRSPRRRLEPMANPAADCPRLEMLDVLRSDRVPHEPHGRSVGGPAGHKPVTESATGCDFAARILSGSYAWLPRNRVLTPDTVPTRSRACVAGGFWLSSQCGECPGDRCGVAVEAGSVPAGVLGRE